jgi:heme-degrading monooxygenase HmoA
MVIRIWSARTVDGPRADAYEDIFRTQVLAELANLDGFAGAYLLRRPHGAGAELMALTLFESVDAVRRFAGTDHEQAVVSAPARAVLDDIDARVRHFTLVAASEPA